MKKFIVLLTSLLLVLTLIACADKSTTQPTENNNTIAAQPETTVATEAATEAVQEVSITDYTITAMVNVTGVRHSVKTMEGNIACYSPAEPGEANAISVYIMCPLCKAESFVNIDFTEIPENQIGLPSFTWSGTEDCSNWSNHADPFTEEYNYSILFTRNN